MMTRYTFIEDPNKDFEVNYNNRSSADYKSRDINMNSNNQPPFFAKFTKIMCTIFYTKVRVMARRAPKAAYSPPPLYSGSKHIFVSDTKTGFR
jgi:hypothetical protein